MEIIETHTSPERIERVLAEFDRPRPDILLHYQGYRLMGEAFSRTTSEGGEFMQEFMGTFPPYSVRARVISRSPEEVFLEEITLVDENHLPRFTTSVRIRIGQTLVLGSAERKV